MFATHLKCVNLKFGPDGALYMTNTYFGDLGRQWISASAESKFTGQ